MPIAASTHYHKLRSVSTSNLEDEIDGLTRNVGWELSFYAM